MKRKLINILLFALLLNGCTGEINDFLSLTSIGITESAIISADANSDITDSHIIEENSAIESTNNPTSTEPITSTETSTITSEATSSSETGTNPDNPDDTYSGSYYNAINDNENGSTLRNALKNLISSNFTQLSYESLATLFATSDLVSGKMSMFYTGTLRSFSYGNMPSKSNKEHVWPQSSFGKTTANGTAGSDAHNVYPCDSQLNNIRANYSFDILPQTSITRVYEGGNAGSYGETNGNLNYGDVNNPDTFNYTNKSGAFYPRVGYRGMTARSLFYTATRYNFTINEEVKSTVSNAETIGKLSTLLKWHLEEPVTDFEIHRNNIIFENWHNNRNPYIDKPQYACKVFGNSNSATQNICNQYI